MCAPFLGSHHAPITPHFPFGFTCKIVGDYAKNKCYPATFHIAITKNVDGWCHNGWCGHPLTNDCLNVMKRRTKLKWVRC